MNSVIVFFILFVIVSYTDAEKSVNDAIKDNTNEKGCVCVSSDYGCERGRMAGNMRQTGYCNTRCCSFPEPGSKEKRKCKCMNTGRCPPDLPEHAGDCPNLVECCPILKKEL